MHISPTLPALQNQVLPLKGPPSHARAHAPAHTHTHTHTHTLTHTHTYHLTLCQVTALHDQQLSAALKELQLATGSDREAAAVAASSAQGDAHLQRQKSAACLFSPAQCDTHLSLQHKVMLIYREEKCSCNAVELLQEIELRNSVTSKHGHTHTHVCTLTCLTSSKYAFTHSLKHAHTPVQVQLHNTHTHMHTQTHVQEVGVGQCPLLQQHAQYKQEQQQHSGAHMQVLFAIFSRFWCGNKSVSCLLKIG